MDLFSMGVFDDERTARERAPKVPVRCLESELLPSLSWQEAKCVRCGVNEPRETRNTCRVCDRAVAATTRQKSERKRYNRRKAEQKMRADGFYVVTKNLRGIADDLVAAGKARWAGKRDLKRIGKPETAQVIMPVERVE